MCNFPELPNDSKSKTKNFNRTAGQHELRASPSRKRCLIECTKLLFGKRHHCVIVFLCNASERKEKMFFIIFELYFENKVQIFCSYAIKVYIENESIS